MKTNYHSPWAKVHHGTGTKLAWIESYDPNDHENPFKGYCFKGSWYHLLIGKKPLIPYKTKRTLKVIAVYRKVPSPHLYLHPKSVNIPMYQP